MPISRRLVQLYRSCCTPTIHLFEFVNISDHSRLINSNLLQRSKISVVDDNEVRNEEDSTNGKETTERLLIYHVLRSFRVVWSQFWTFSKCLLALETTTNNQEVKTSLNRLQNANHLRKAFIRFVQIYRSYWTSRIHLLEFINISDHGILINSNILQRQSLIFYCLLKDFDLLN